MRSHALEHHGHGEGGGVERGLHLLPAERCRDRGPGMRPHRVDGGDRLALPVLVRVDQHTAPPRLRPFRRCETRMGAHDRTGDNLGEPACVRVGRATVERHEHVEALATRGFRKRSQAQRVEELPQDERDLDRLRPRHLGRRIEVEEDEVRPVRAIDTRVPGVHVDAAHVHHPEQRELVVDDRKAHRLPG